MTICYATLHLLMMCPPLCLAACDIRFPSPITICFAIMLSMSHLTLFIYTIIGLCLCFGKNFPEESCGLLLCVKIFIGIRTLIYATGIFLVIAHYMKCILTLEEEEEI